MKFGDYAEFHVEHIDAKGRGCGTVNDRPVCAHFTFPGDTVEGTMVRRRKGVRILRADRIVVPCPDRVTPRCAFAGTCGGCMWQALAYPRQLELKRGLVNDAFARHGVPTAIGAVDPCPQLFGFRNRMDYCIGPDGELGLKEPGRWNAYLDLTECHLLSEDAVRLMDAFRGWMRGNGVRPWDAKRHAGYARYLVVREGKNTGKRMATVVTGAGTLPDRDGLVSALSPFATTIYHGVNPAVTDISVAEMLELLHGEALLEERVGDKTFLIAPNAFFQTNTLMAERLVDAVRRHVTATAPKTVLDLYCGTGLFAISLADAAERVMGVEIEPSAVAAARRNAERNGAANTSFFAAKAEQHVWDDLSPELVIVDPPRAGLHPKMIATLMERRPERIVYVSCSHERFADEWRHFADGYRITEAEAFDLFPHSPHVELVALFERK